MANLPWPSDISYGRIIGQFAYMDGDSDDKDTTPDMVPAMGTVTITPSVNQVKYNGVEGPKILVPRKILGKLDANGYLVGPDGKQGIVVPSTSNSVLNPSGWTYAVSINITDGGTINLDISLEPGEEKDITTAVPIPASGGTVRIIDESTALRAEAAASSVFNIVSEIRDDIEAGKTKGDPGKDAANPNISAQANTTAPGSNAAAAVSGSYPDLTFAFDIPRGDPGKDAANPVITPAVTKIAPGGNPTFNITGTYPNQTYTFGLVTGGKGDKGDPGAVPTAADYTIVGIGRPDIPSTMDTTIASKVSTAPIGCEFISTDGPQGAWRWQKTTAGWTVLLGDTGWRTWYDNADVAQAVMFLAVRRIGSNVDFWARVFNGTNSAGWSTQPEARRIPVGFRPVRPPAMVANRSGTTEGIHDGHIFTNLGLYSGNGDVHVISPGSTFNITNEGMPRVKGDTPNTQDWYHLTWVMGTTAPWPTTLPGTAP